MRKIDLLDSCDGSRCREIAKDPYRRLRGLGQAKDIVVLEEVLGSIPGFSRDQGRFK